VLADGWTYEASKSIQPSALKRMSEYSLAAGLAAGITTTPPAKGRCEGPTQHFNAKGNTPATPVTGISTMPDQLHLCAVRGWSTLVATYRRRLARCERTTALSTSRALSTPAARKIADPSSANPTRYPMLRTTKIAADVHSRRLTRFMSPLLHLSGLAVRNSAEADG
jgi:hypothetical protein